VRDVLLAIPFGVAIGLALGLVGAGGSLLTVPILVFVLGQSARQATTATLVIVGITAVAGAIEHARHGAVRWRVAATFGAAAAAGAVGGTALNRLVNEDALLAAFGVLMLAAAYALARGRPSTAPPVERRIGPGLLLAGLAVGVLTGFFGVGGGFVVVPVLVLLVGLRIDAAVGTSLVVVALACAAALAGHLATESLDWTLVGVFTGAAVAGALVGARLSGRIPPVVLARGFAVLVGGVGLFLIAKNIAVLT
jgi:uncharacterized membrane protein YfcA